MYKILIRIAMAAFAAVAILSCGSNAAGNLPVGVFDSGTGGFTVLERILALPELSHEDFQYLADQANMPYGRYAAEGKADYLTDLAVKDAFFLTGESFSRDSSSLVPDATKPAVKIVVIGCNTATAYGLEAIRDTLAALGSSIRVIGVVEAGSRGALGQLASKGLSEAAIGVLATPGTISSGVYERTLLSLAPASVMKVEVCSQGGYSFAEAVDEESSVVDRSLTGFSEGYLGPVFGQMDSDINPNLLDAYAFDFSDGKAFIEKDADGKPLRIQLNSADNYARFNLVNLVEKARLAKLSNPLECIILGCTHYPFLLATLQQHLDYLRSFTLSDGSHPYESVIAENCIFVDPAVNVARDCLAALKEDGIMARRCRHGRLSSFISVPSSHLPDSLLSADGGLSYAYKYGRNINDGSLSTVVVPMSRKTVNPDNLERIRRLLPLSWEALGL